MTRTSNISVSAEEMVHLARVQKAADETLGCEFKPETYWLYFEDLNLQPNAEMG
jgi:hypothetical protein